MARRHTPFADIVRDLTPFFVSRQIFTGAGKLGAEAQWDERGKSIFYWLFAVAIFYLISHPKHQMAAQWKIADTT